jgi:hypothetical protein
MQAKAKVEREARPYIMTNQHQYSALSVYAEKQQDLFFAMRVTEKLAHEA